MQFRPSLSVYGNLGVDSEAPSEAKKVNNATCQRVTEHYPNFEPVQFRQIANQPWSDTMNSELTKFIAMTLGVIMGCFFGSMIIVHWMI